MTVFRHLSALAAVLLLAVGHSSAQTSVESFFTAPDDAVITVTNDADHPWTINEDGVLMSNIHEDNGYTSITYTNNSGRDLMCTVELGVNSDIYDINKLWVCTDQYITSISGLANSKFVLFVLKRSQSVKFEYYRNMKFTGKNDLGYINSILFTNIDANSILYDWTLTLNKDEKNATVVKYHGNEINVEIPSKYNYNGSEFTINTTGSNLFNLKTAPNSVSYNYKIKSVKISSSITNIGDETFTYCFNLTSVDIPSSVTRIGIEAFNYCTNLTSIEIPSSVISIENHAFECCSSLPSIKIPSSVTYISDWVFAGCNSLSSIVVDPNNPNYDSRSNCNAIINTSTNEMIAGCYNTFIPSSVTKIGRGVLLDIKGLTALVFPSHVSEIYGWSYNGSSLQCITLPSSLSYVSNGLFSCCSSLKYVIFPTEEVIAPSDNFANKYNFPSCTLYVPASLVEDYKSATGWKDFGTILPIPSTADYSIYANALPVRPGEQMTLSIMMNNVNPITGWQADLKLPEGFSIAKDDADDDIVTVATDRTTEEAHSIITNELPDGRIRIMENSATNATFEGTSGKVATIVLNVDENVNPGDYYLEFFNVKLAEANAYATKHEAGTAVSTFRVLDYMDGDVNNDKNVDIADLVQIVNYIMERPTVDCIDAAADVNKDGDINGIDYIGEINLIMNYGYAKTRKAAKVMQPTTSGFLSTSYMNMQKGSSGSMNINLNAQGNKYSLVQFDITLPDGLSIAEEGASILGSNSIKHDITIQQLRNNTYRVLMYSDSKANIREEANGIIALSFAADKDIEEGEYNALITGQLLVSGDGSYSKPSATSAKIYITEPTSVESVSSNHSNADIYTTDGILIRKSADANSAIQGLSKGMYIINGKKVIVK